jgi:hypothetical protein
MMHSLRLPLLGAVALLTFAAPVASWASDHKPAACKDDTPHEIRMVKVAPGVELEVLEGDPAHSGQPRQRCGTSLLHFE